MGFGDKSNKDKRAEAAEAAETAAAKTKEDNAWEEDDKKNKAKGSRANAKAASADAKLAKADEKKILEAEEDMATSKLSGANKGKAKAGATKLTAAQIAKNKAMMAALSGPGNKGGGGYPAAKSSKTETVPQPELKPNPNHNVDTVEASGLDRAISALSGLDGEETPTAGKMKYKDYEAQLLPQLKEENPGLKLHQLKERAWKQWERAPENPKNQA